MSVRIGYMPGAFPAGGESANYLRDLVSVGEEFGYDSLWLSDRVVGQRCVPDPMVALSMVAGYSESLKFGTSVLQLPVRNPVIVAKEIATLDCLSGGRFLPAVGLGPEDPKEYEACGVSKSDRGRRTDEAMVVIRRLLTEDNVSHEGEFFSLSGVTIEPKPVQQPSVPIWIGGNSAAAQRRVGRVGDGWLVSSATPDEVRAGIKVVFSSAAEHGRSVDEDHMGAILGFLIAPDREEAVTLAEAHITRARPEVSFTNYSALGSPERVAETIQRYLDAGASKFVVRPLCSPGEALAQLALFGEKVLPRYQQ